MSLTSDNIHNGNSNFIALVHKKRNYRRIISVQISSTIISIKNSNGIRILRILQLSDSFKPHFFFQVKNNTLRTKDVFEYVKKKLTECFGRTEDIVS